MADQKRDSNFELIKNQLDAIVGAVDEAVIGCTPQGIITSWNPAAERMFGYSPGEMIGKPTSVLVASDLAHQERQLFELVAEGERVDHHHTQRTRKDGQAIDVSLTFRSIKDPVARVIGILTIATDISDRKRLDRAERDQLFLASIVSSADDAIISKDLNGIVTSWNKGAERVFGYTAEDMINQPIVKLIPQDQLDEEVQILRHIRNGGRIEHYDTKRIRKDGRLIDVSLTISPIRDRIGHIIGASKIARDITDRRRWERAEAAESFLGALVESAEDAIISKTLDGIVTSWNPAAEKLYGYVADEMIGKPVSILIPPDHPDEEPQILERIRRGERIHHYETKRLHKTGRLLDIALTISPIKDGLGRIFGASKIARDITEQKRSEAREREMLRQAEEAKRTAEDASRAKDEFLATISHELRTPMTAILGWSQMLMSGQVNVEAQKRAIETINRNARSQAQLIEDLLDISRIVSGRLRIDFKLVDLNAVIAAAVEAVRPAAEAKRIRMQTILAAGAGPIVGDAERLQQVVWNLVSNAVRFTPEQGFVQVELRRVETQIELRVTDNGIGIRPEFLPRIFERFSQADSSITRSHGGLGMGLAIVKSLVELHGGVVSASSPGEGRGAMFTVKLPISAVRQDSRFKPAQKPSLDAVIADHHELVGIKILVVDDERDTCELLRFVFNECGAIVEVANSAKEALELFDTWQPDILVSDIGMPDLDGYELIRAIRNERASRIPAVALTALARIDDRIKVLNAGYQMHVSKPVEPVELISIVSSLSGLVNRHSGV